MHLRRPPTETLRIVLEGAGCTTRREISGVIHSGSSNEAFQLDALNSKANNITDFTEHLSNMIC